MKKLLIIFAASILGMVACNDKVELKNEIDYKSISKPKVSLKKILKVVGKDITGAVAGALAGSNIGKNIDPSNSNDGAKKGAIAGGVAGGAGASATEAGGIIYNPNNPNVGNPIANDIVPNTLMANLNNAYNNIGLTHYTIMNDFIKSIDNGQNLNLFYGFAMSIVIPAFNYDVTDTVFFPKSAYDNVLTSLPNEGNLVADLNNLYSANLISQEVFDILNPYFQTFDDLEDIEEEDFDDFIGFVNYSITQENNIVNNQQLSEEDKRIVLLVMATARYGIQYWNHFF
jgi:hypothetical protein